MALDSQQVELIGRGVLFNALIRDGIEIATPARDRGVDLIAYLDRDLEGQPFVACPIQLKASSNRMFGLWQKLRKFDRLLLVYAWFVHEPAVSELYALSFGEAYGIAEHLGWTATPSWIGKGEYSSRSPSAELRELLVPFKMEAGMWREKIKSAASTPTALSDPDEPVGTVVSSVPKGRRNGDSTKHHGLLDGFSDFITFNKLDLTTVPSAPGVYAVITDAVEASFLDVSVGGHFKGRDPTVDVGMLRARWVAECPIVYIGKATSLRSRIRQLRDFGSGRPVAHWGGRYLWQLANHDNLRVAWRTPAEDPADVEAHLLEKFVERYGQPPFANIAPGRSSGGMPA